MHAWPGGWPQNGVGLVVDMYYIKKGGMDEDDHRKAEERSIAGVIGRLVEFLTPYTHFL